MRATLLIPLLILLYGLFHFYKLPGHIDAISSSSAKSQPGVTLTGIVVDRDQSAPMKDAVLEASDNLLACPPLYLGSFHDNNGDVIWLNIASCFDKATLNFKGSVVLPSTEAQRQKWLSPLTKPDFFTNDSPKAGTSLDLAILASLAHLKDKGWSVEETNRILVIFTTGRWDKNGLHRVIDSLEEARNEGFDIDLYTYGKDITESDYDELARALSCPYWKQLDGKEGKNFSQPYSVDPRFPGSLSHSNSGKELLEKVDNELWPSV